MLRKIKIKNKIKKLRKGREILNIKKIKKIARRLCSSLVSYRGGCICLCYNPYFKYA